MIHELKTWPHSFQAVKRGQKKFEYRKHDRDFNIGHTLHLREYDNYSSAYTGDELFVGVDFVQWGDQFGIPKGYCIMSISPINLVKGFKGIRNDDNNKKESNSRTSNKLRPARN